MGKQNRIQLKVGELFVHRWEWINIESPKNFFLLCILIIMLLQIQKLYLVPNSNFVLGLVNEMKKRDNLVFDNLDLCYCDISILTLNALSQLGYNFGDITLEK